MATAEGELNEQHEAVATAEEELTGEDAAAQAGDARHTSEVSAEVPQDVKGGLGDAVHHNVSYSDSGDRSMPGDATATHTNPHCRPHYRPQGLRPTPAAQGLAGPTVHILLEGYVSPVKLVVMHILAQVLGLCDTVPVLLGWLVMCLHCICSVHRNCVLGLSN